MVLPEEVVMTPGGLDAFKRGLDRFLEDSSMHLHANRSSTGVPHEDT